MAYHYYCNTYTLFYFTNLRISERNEECHMRISVMRTTITIVVLCYITRHIFSLPESGVLLFRHTHNYRTLIINVIRLADTYVCRVYALGCCLRFILYRN